MTFSCRPGDIDESAGQRMTTSPLSLALADLTEKQLATQVVDLARTLGWWRYHTYRSERSEPGWPDEALVRDRLILIELKTERGKLSDAQCDVLTRLYRAGVETYLIRPRHLALLARVLSVRMVAGYLPRNERGEDARAAQRRLVDELRGELGIGVAG